MKKIKFLVVAILILIILLTTVVTSFADIVLLGDSNLNEKLDINDATLIQLHLASLNELKGSALSRADANNDGVIAISDATVVQLCLVHVDKPRYRELDDEVHYPFVPFEN